MEQRQYLCIDQKSYYATVECVARGLNTPQRMVRIDRWSWCIVAV